MQIGAIVLCGGESRRMGSPKAWLPFLGEPMLLRVIGILQEVLDPLIVVAAPEQDLPELPPDVHIARDATPGQGPLQGLATGLAALANRADAAYVSSCDVPLLQTAFVRCLIDLLDDNDIVVPREDGFYHPLAAIYRTSILPGVEAALQAGERRVVAAFDRCRVRIVPVEDLRKVDPNLRSLQNVNTPDDYQAILKAAESL